MTESPGGGTGPRATRSLSRPVAFVAGLALFAGFLVVARIFHGTWSRTLHALLAPGLFAFALVVLVFLERARRRPFKPLHWAVAIVTLAPVAGGIASALAPGLGSVRVGILGGMFWGTLIAIGWYRASRRRPDGESRASRSEPM